MFRFFKKIFGVEPKAETAMPEAPYKLEVMPTEVVESDSKPSPQRAKDSKGRFVANDPATPENEAWVGGKSPAKKTGPKKAAPKKPATRGRKPKAK